MNLLLDTHTLIWWLADDDTLSDEARSAIGNPQNQVFVSAVSTWEIAIKSSIGKLTTPDNLLMEIPRNQFQELPITMAHGDAAGRLPLHHRDPFDRMLIGQAKTEQLTVVTRDRRFAKYEVDILHT